MSLFFLIYCLLFHNSHAYVVTSVKNQQQQRSIHGKTGHRTQLSQLQGTTVYTSGGDALPPGKTKTYLSNKACTSQLGGFDIVAEEIDLTDEQVKQQSGAHGLSTIRLQNVGSGWGNGAHPTTKLCFNFLAKTVNSGQTVLDYGTGSGILAILAAKLGAKSVVAVDIDEDTIVAATKNALLNGVAEKIDITHTRYVYVGEDRFPLADITVANILPGTVDDCSTTEQSTTTYTLLKQHRNKHILCTPSVRTLSDTLSDRPYQQPLWYTLSYTPSEHPLNPPIQPTFPSHLLNSHPLTHPLNNRCSFYASGDIMELYQARWSAMRQWTATA